MRDDTLGPVSAALAADLQDLTRQHGFVLWPDRPGAFTDLVDRLVGRGHRVPQEARRAGRDTHSVASPRGHHPHPAP